MTSIDKRMAKSRKGWTKRKRERERNAESDAKKFIFFIHKLNRFKMIQLICKWKIFFRQNFSFLLFSFVFSACRICHFAFCGIVRAMTLCVFVRNFSFLFFFFENSNETNNFRFAFEAARICSFICSLTLRVAPPELRTTLVLLSVCAFGRLHFIRRNKTKQTTMSAKTRKDKIENEKKEEFSRLARASSVQRHLRRISSHRFGRFNFGPSSVCMCVCTFSYRRNIFFNLLFLLSFSTFLRFILSLLSASSPSSMALRICRLVRSSSSCSSTFFQAIGKSNQKAKLFFPFRVRFYFPFYQQQHLCSFILLHHRQLESMTTTMAVTVFFDDAFCVEKVLAATPKSFFKLQGTRLIEMKMKKKRDEIRRMDDAAKMMLSCLWLFHYYHYFYRARTTTAKNPTRKKNTKLKLMRWKCVDNVFDMRYGKQHMKYTWASIRVFDEN